MHPAGINFALPQAEGSTLRQRDRFSRYIYTGAVTTITTSLARKVTPAVTTAVANIAAITEANAIIYSLMEAAKANSLRLDDDLLHLLSILPKRAERNKDFEVDDLLPWSEEMKSWFSAV